MKAVLLIAHGAEESLCVEKNVNVPEISTSSQMRVAIRACCVSPLDVEVRRGTFSGSVVGGIADLTPKCPAVIGYGIAGTVESVGRGVVDFSVGDSVAVFLPLNHGGGYGELVVTESVFAVSKPAEVGFEEAACSLLAGIRAFGAIHYSMNAISGESILILNGASGSMHLALQLAIRRQLRVLTTCRTSEELNYLQDLPIPPSKIIDVSSEDLKTTVLAETGGIGVDHILEDLDHSAPEAFMIRNDLIDCLAAHSHWVCSTPHLQLDPPDSARLFLKGAGLSVAFEQSWVLSCTQLGRYSHILTEVMTHLADGRLAVNVKHRMPVERIREAHRTAELLREGCVVVVQAK